MLITTNTKYHAINNKGPKSTARPTTTKTSEWALKNLHSFLK